MPSLFPSPTDFRDILRQQLPDIPDINEPGFASTFDYNALKQRLWDYGGLVPIGALGAALWYHNRAPKQPAIKAKKSVPVVEKQAATDLKTVLENIRWHLPKIRVPDTAAGIVGGAGAGALYDLIRGRGKDNKSKTLRRVLTGALAGAGVSNVVGDRFRRYISNTKLPLGYRPDASDEVKPSLSRIWNAAILDKQDYDPKAMKYWRATNMLPVLPARHEIVRRQFGLPFDKKNPWWQKNPEGYYSLNEKSPDYARRLRLLFGSHSHRGIQRDEKLKLYSGPEQILKNPEKALPAFSRHPHRQNSDYDFFGSGQLFGGMHLPYQKNPDGSYSGMAIDRWDLTHNKAERAFARDNWLKMLTDSKWRKAPLKDVLSWYLKPGQHHTNSSAMKALAGRFIWDNILSDELPWVGQKFQVQPNTQARTWGQAVVNAIKPGAVSGKYAPNTLQFLKADNSPATPAMDYAALDKWDQNK